MKKQTIRVPLTDANFHNRSSRLDFSPVLQPEEPWAPALPATAAYDNADQEFDVLFGLRAESLPQWTSPLSGYPRTVVQFNVSDSDMPRVAGWFTGNYENVLQPPSDNLIRNLSDAVESALLSYFSAANAVGLFTSPFRIGWAFRHSDGRCVMTRPMSLIRINPSSPLMSIDSHTFLTGAVRSVTDIINKPYRLRFLISGNVPVSEDITHIDIVGSQQVSLVPANLKATGTYIASRDGRRYHSYRYNGLDETEVIGSAGLQNDLRVIASIPVSDLGSSDELDVPLIQGALSNWKLLEKFSASSGAASGTDPAEPNDPAVQWEPYIDKITDPLDLGAPECRKWLWRVVLRGCYDRSSLRLRVYASRHRQSWRLIADGKRGWASALTHLGYRWFKVRVTGAMRLGDFVDVVTFHVTRSR